MRVRYIGEIRTEYTRVWSIKTIDYIRKSEIEYLACVPSLAHEADDDEEEHQTAEGELTIGSLEAHAFEVGRGHLKPQ